MRDNPSDAKDHVSQWIGERATLLLPFRFSRRQCRHRGLKLRWLTLGGKLLTVKSRTGRRKTFTVGFVVQNLSGIFVKGSKNSWVSFVGGVGGCLKWGCGISAVYWPCCTSRVCECAGSWCPCLTASSHAFLSKYSD